MFLTLAYRKKYMYIWHGIIYINVNIFHFTKKNFLLYFVCAYFCCSFLPPRVIWYNLATHFRCLIKWKLCDQLDLWYGAYTNTHTLLNKTYMPHVATVALWNEFVLFYNILFYFSFLFAVCLSLRRKRRGAAQRISLIM